MEKPKLIDEVHNLYKDSFLIWINSIGEGSGMLYKTCSFRIET